MPIMSSQKVILLTRTPIWQIRKRFLRRKVQIFQACIILTFLNDYLLHARYHFISFCWHFFLSFEAKSHQKWMLKILLLKWFHLLDATFDRFTQSFASMTFIGTAWNRYGCHRFHRFSLTWHFRGGSCKSFWIVRNRSSPNLDAL